MPEASTIIWRKATIVSSNSKKSKKSVAVTILYIQMDKRTLFIIQQNFIRTIYGAVNTTKQHLLKGQQKGLPLFCSPRSRATLVLGLCYRQHSISRRRKKRRP
ncbi:unnamed protein product, partial [Heterosigma akashiwo]